MALIILLMVVVFWEIPASAQGDIPVDVIIESIEADGVNRSASESSGESLPVQDGNNSEVSIIQKEYEIETIRAEIEAMKFQRMSFVNAERVMAWHFMSSIIIFFVVLTIIGIGLYFSYLQFKLSVIQRKDKISPSTLKIGRDGFEISSSIIGLLILIISLAFFYLYLENVYPIRVISPANQRQETTP
ncbi:MAG: hypothetical protein F6K42_12925 [Leptolyngbya sp. SIO1D8]|nr:hypothetical protein [Leptolyngbya sp. SIO1D8]